MPAATKAIASSQLAGRSAPPLRSRSSGVVSRSGDCSGSAAVQPLRHSPPRLVGKSRACTTSRPGSDGSGPRRMAHCSAQYGQCESVPRLVRTGDIVSSEGSPWFERTSPPLPTHGPCHPAPATVSARSGLASAPACRHARRVPSTRPLPRFLLLYAALFAAFGVASPFLPGLLMQDGLSPQQLSTVLAAGTAIRLLAGPLGGRLADRSGHAPRVLAGFAAAAALIALLYGPARGAVLLFAVGVAHAAVLAPLTPVADALALGSATAGRGFAYGWVRGAGSAAFIAGVLLSGQAVQRWGLDSAIWQNAALLACAAACAPLLPNRMAGTAAAPPRDTGAMLALLRRPALVRLVGVAALVGGSHAMHDAFAVVRWRAAGLSAAQCSALWSLAVAGEVVVFLLIGPPLLARLGPGRALALAAAAGLLRWGVEAQTARLLVVALVEPLHGLTFALLHLAAMEVISRDVPVPLAATAQAFYATVAMGAAAALATLASGPLYDSFGPHAFWAMALLCAAALPLALRLRPPGDPAPTI